MEQAAGAALAQLLLLKGLIKGHLGSPRIVQINLLLLKPIDVLNPLVGRRSVLFRLCHLQLALLPFFSFLSLPSIIIIYSFA